MTLFKTKTEALEHMGKHGGTLEWTRSLVECGVPGINHCTADDYPWCVVL